MKNMLNGLKCAVWAVLAMGLAHGARAENVAEVTFEPVASVTTNGVTTLYGTLTGAWADAMSLVKDVDVLVTLLKDATVDATLVRSSRGKALTLDLNDKVLSYAGTSDACVISQQGGTALHVIDTATTRTPRYFTCDDATGLWTLADHETDLVVRGGLVTGGRAGAFQIAYGSGPHSISNVNFVGNSSASNGGAVSTSSAGYALKIAATEFFGNIAKGNGGAIYAAGLCEMTDCRVASNVAAEMGGGLYLKIKGSLVRTEVVGNTASMGGGVYQTFSASGCFPAGVRIRLADGSEKKVEEIVKGDVVATFDHLGGTNSSAAVFSIYRGTEPMEAFTLSFASGARLDVADCHDLLLETTRKYVTISSENALSYVGKRFYNYATVGWDELTGVTATTAAEAHYSLYTRGHGNCVANGMLTVPDDKDCFINVYELDADLKADAVRLAADIEMYGLATTADYPNVPADEFADHNMRYARIAIGKGLTTQERILFWNEFDYGPVAQETPVSAPKLMATALPKMLTGSPSDAPADRHLSVGEGTVVTGNVNSAGRADNVYLDRSKEVVIDVQQGAINLDVGVTLSNVRGVFTDTTAADYLSRFTSDNSKYTVCRGSDGRLWIATDLQVGDDAWADLTDGTCEIFGIRDMWSSSQWTAGNPLAGVKSQIRSVDVTDGVTSIGDWAFQKFYALTNVTAASTVTSVGIGAFSRCLGIEAMTFAGEKPTLGEKAFTIRAGIRMEGGEPVVYPIPKVTYGGNEPTLYGKPSLTNEQWEAVTDANKDTFHFFTYEEQ